MTPKQFRSARESFGLTQSQFARELRLKGDDGRSVRSWETGEIDLPGPVQLAVETLIIRRALKNGYAAKYERWRSKVMAEGGQ